MATPRPLTVSDLLDRAAITDVVTAYATGVDRRDWALYRSIFTDQVDFDFSTWAGIRQTIDADTWVGMVKDTLACFDATQHTLTNWVIDVDGDTAVCVVSMVARHHVKIDGVPQNQLLGGFYRHRLLRTAPGWKIRECSLTITWEEGERSLFEAAHKLGPRPRVDVGTQGM